MPQGAGLHRRHADLHFLHWKDVVATTHPQPVFQTRYAPTHGCIIYLPSPPDTCLLQPKHIGHTLAVWTQICEHLPPSVWVHVISLKARSSCGGVAYYLLEVQTN